MPTGSRLNSGKLVSRKQNTLNLKPSQQIIVGKCFRLLRPTETEVLSIVLDRPNENYVCLATLRCNKEQKIRVKVSTSPDPALFVVLIDLNGSLIGFGQCIQWWPISVGFGSLTFIRRSSNSQKCGPLKKYVL